MNCAKSLRLSGPASALPGAVGSPSSQAHSFYPHISIFKERMLLSSSGIERERKMIASAAHTTVTSCESMRQIRLKACRWRDMLWQTVLEDLAERDPDAARAARAATLPRWRACSASGASTQAAALAWRYLDYEARKDWLWICTAMQQMLMRGALELQRAVGYAREGNSPHRV